MCREERAALAVWKEEEGYSSKKWKIDESSHLKWVYNNHTKWQGAWQVKDYAIVLWPCLGKRQSSSLHVG